MEERKLLAAENAEKRAYRGFGVTRRWRATYDEFLACLARCASTHQGDPDSGVGKLCEKISRAVQEQHKTPFPVPVPPDLGARVGGMHDELQRPLSPVPPRIISTSNEGEVQKDEEEVALPTPPVARRGTGAAAPSPRKGPR